MNTLRFLTLRKVYGTKTAFLQLTMNNINLMVLDIEIYDIRRSFIFKMSGT